MKILAFFILGCKQMLFLVQTPVALVCFFAAKFFLALTWQELVIVIVILITFCYCCCYFLVQTPLALVCFLAAKFFPGANLAGIGDCYYTSCTAMPACGPASIWAKTPLKKINFDGNSDCKFCCNEVCKFEIWIVSAASTIRVIFQKLKSDSIQKNIHAKFSITHTPGS